MGMYRARFRQDEVQQGTAFTNWTHLDNLAACSVHAGDDPAGTDQHAARVVRASQDRLRPRELCELRRGRGPPLRAGRLVLGTDRRRCECPPRPIKVWEVWNEPNLAPYWDFPNPAEYAALLSATRSKLRKADRSARILFGGLAYPTSFSTTKLEPNAFLRDVIAAAGPKSFDALALHNYRPNAAVAVNTLIAGTVNALKTYGGVEASGAPKHQVWVNEFGRPTTPDDPATLADEQASSEAVQKTWQDDFIGYLETNRTAWNLGPLMWYSLRDSHAATASWHRQGLRRTTSEDTDAGPKPSWEAYATRSVLADWVNLPVAR